MKLSLINERLLTCNSEQGYDASQSTPAAIHRRSLRNQARRKLEKAGRVKKGDGKHVHHKRPLSKNGSNSTANLAVSSAEKNWAEGNKISSKTRKK